MVTNYIVCVKMHCLISICLVDALIKISVCSTEETTGTCTVNMFKN